VKSLTWILAIALFGLILIPARASYSSLYVFGDALSTTTNNASQSQNYYGKRYSNGRVWVEVLAQRQGLPYNANNNWSYFDCNSANLVTNASKFTAPPDATNALFIIWVNNSDLYDEALNGNSNLAEWTLAINRCQTNYFKAITNLYYAKGLRTLVAPNAVDISAVPFFNAALNAGFIRQRCIAFNTNFTATLNKARVACPLLKIYSPDYFALLDNVLTNAANYGLRNVTLAGLSIDAMDDTLLLDKSLNGPGANYVFWDYLDPTARLHAIMADVAQQLVSPVQVSQITAFAGSNQLDVVNLPVGLSGFVEGTTNLLRGDWTNIITFNSTGAAQTFFVMTTNTSAGFAPRAQDLPPGGTPYVTALGFYRLRFPYAWNWP
jgi:phospholipase/lecithinase/hemolysin